MPLVVLAEVLQFRTARVLRYRFDYRGREAPSELFSNLVQRLDAAHSRRRCRNDHIKVNSPCPDELLCYRTDLTDRGGITLILQPVEQVPDIGTVGIELFVTKLVIAKELAAAGM